MKELATNTNLSGARKRGWGKGRALLALAALLGTACGDGGTGPQPPSAPVATRVELSPASVSLSAIGETMQLSATVQDQMGARRMTALAREDQSQSGVALS